MFRRSSSVALVLVAVCLWPERSQAGFTVVDLGVSAPGVTSSATGINAAGSTSGTATVSGKSTALMGTVSSGFQPVNTSQLVGLTSSVGNGIDGSGNVIGTFTDGKNHSHAFGSANGLAYDVGSFADPKLQGADSWGVAVNSQGVMAGTAQLLDLTEVAFRAVGTQVSTITLPNQSRVGRAGGINNNGTVVGSYVNGLGVSRVFTAVQGANATDLLSNYTVRGFGQNTYGTGIDDRGDVTGYGDFNGQSHAFFASATGQFVDIGVLSGFTSSVATGINNQGQVVGHLDVGGTASRAFLWDQTAGLFDLNNLLAPSDRALWTLTLATGINDKDQISGQGYVNGVLHGFVLQPDPGTLPFGPPLTVPTPSSAVLTIAALVALAGWGRFRRAKTAGLAGV